VLDGSRFLVYWDLRESMKEADIEIILERAKERYPEAKPRIISDNYSGLGHEALADLPYYPQSNGKLEHWHKSLKRECISPGTPLTPGGCALGDPAVHRPLQLSAVAESDRDTSRPQDMPAGKPRSTRPATGNWRRRAFNGTAQPAGGCEILVRF
jgi:hypothetical protein